MRLRPSRLHLGSADAVVRLGLRENLSQFALLIVVNGCVGAMVGMERSILPVIAEQEFDLAARTAILSFIVVFGFSKAVTNYLAGTFADRIGRKHVLVAGWLTAVPGTVPPDVGARLELDSCGKRAAWHQPRLHMVYDGHHEDRSRRS